jgi:hypothetical protein
MKRKGLTLLSILAAGAAISALGGCADSYDPNAVREEPVYVTGSNIARKQHSGEVSIMSADAFERARSAVNPPIPQTPGGSH